MFENLKIALIGEGSWATAIVKILQQNIKNIIWVIRDADMALQIKETGHNPLYISDIEINTNIVTLVQTVKEAISQANVILVVLPAAFIESSMEGITEDDFKNKFIFSATKGMIPSCHKTVCSFFNENFNVPFNQLGFISGPSHAEEVALERLTFLTILSSNIEMAAKMGEMFNCRYIRTIISDDIIGAEYVTSLKNVMAIAAGVSHGLGYGDNYLSVLVSNAIREIQSFLNIIFPAERDLLKYVYLGDLLVTCYSQFSRNRNLGTMIGKGYTVKSAQLEMNMIAEGYYTAKSIMEICREKNIEMPITQAMYRILYERYSPSVEMKLLTDKLK
ncbi:MAG: glycerol-3-phosphate dehydrogenase [Bacteroidetes bacterium CG23_combo_of_CG06-09_8_20_14_all_32_9]|nr:MAG: glycerol-3-phosphate dehydrogenase [Bacteroidetes bacterium CG23_combo_of_CG06-09_8_20_14_all_32_9]